MFRLPLLPPSSSTRNKMATFTSPLIQARESLFFSSNSLPHRTYFPVPATGLMFSRACHRSGFPRLPLVSCFPLLSPVSCFPALAPVSCLLHALFAGLMFSRSCPWLRVTTLWLAYNTFHKFSNTYLRDILFFIQIYCNKSILFLHTVRGHKVTKPTNVFHLPRQLEIIQSKSTCTLIFPGRKP